MYGELPVTAAESFEGHLASCSDCADEFAGIALARYSVYEWNREEFEHLATPVISIDYTPSRGRFAAWKEFFGPVPGFAYGAVGVLSLAAFFGIAFFSTSDTAADFFVSTDGTGASQAHVAAVETLPEAADLTAAVPGPEEDAATADTRIEPETATPVRVRYSTPKRATTTSRRSVVPSADVIEAQAPRLNEFEDDALDGLRLADLVAELDSE